MNNASLTRLASALLSTALIACGGGGDTAPVANTGAVANTSAPPPSSTPTSGQLVEPLPPAPASTPTPASTTPAAPAPEPTPAPTIFSATLVAAPPAPGYEWEGTPFNFVVSGTGLQNVELVSANDSSIVYGRFTVSPDGTSATLTFAFGRYATYNLRILAWDAPPGQGGRVIEVMPPTRYTVRHNLGCAANPNSLCTRPAP